MNQTPPIDTPVIDKPAKPKPRRKSQQQTNQKTRRQPPYAVILHNDDRNTMVFVVGVLRKVFGYSTTKSLRLMMTAHFAGRAQVWSGAREVAELKADQIRSCGPDPLTASRGAGPLGVSLEPLESR